MNAPVKPHKASPKLLASNLYTIQIAHARRTERAIRQQLIYWTKRKRKNDADLKRLGLKPEK
jgi:hypothetical protein